MDEKPPLEPPLVPMLGRLSRELPEGGYVYEPKWDGFRVLAFRDGQAVDLRSRHDRPLARYFPELSEALGRLSSERFVVDGEVLVTGDGRFDFPALMRRIHPAASRVARLREEWPAVFVAFDLLALGDEDLRARPFLERRARLGELLEGCAAPLHLTPATGQVEVARGWLERYQGRGIDGVMAKPRDVPYRAGARAMIKVKPERTADCVVAGFRVFEDPPVVASLLLGLYEDSGSLVHVGVVSALANARRRELIDELSPHVVPLAGHPWERGFLVCGGATGRLPGAAGRWTPGMGLDWVPLEPVLVCEVAHDQLDGNRFRHGARFRRWRPDREAASCRVDQLELPAVTAAEALSP
jgi:ATP-dependent DNA ligase